MMSPPTPAYAPAYMHSPALLVSHLLLCTPLLLLLLLLQGVNEVASLLMRRDYVHVNTVLDDEAPSHEAIVQVRWL